jgi:antitoxin (DNA-binding transcriptional repressor) of toxin-antitoxin stability system
MKVVSIYEAKAHLSKLIASLEGSEDRIVLCRHGVPVADLIPHRKEAPLLEPNPALVGARFLGLSPVAKTDSAEKHTEMIEEEWPPHLL